MFEYDEDEAVQFIGLHLPQDLKEKFPDDTLYYILDLIAEFYENYDWLSEEDEEKEENELLRFIIRHAGKDDIGQFSADDIRLVLAAETAYSDTLDIPE
jgi:hypothetical protein